MKILFSLIKVLLAGRLCGVYVLSFFPCELCSGLEEPVTLISFPEVGRTCCLLLQFKSECSIPSVCFYFYCLQGHWYWIMLVLAFLVNNRCLRLEIFLFYICCEEFGKVWPALTLPTFLLFLADSMEIHDSRWRPSNEEPSLQADSSLEYSLCGP